LLEPMFWSSYCCVPSFIDSFKHTLKLSSKAIYFTLHRTIWLVCFHFS
jgi:hypothetical protein